MEIHWVAQRKGLTPTNDFSGGFRKNRSNTSTLIFSTNILLYIISN